MKEEHYYATLRQSCSAGARSNRMQSIFMANLEPVPYGRLGEFHFQ